MLAKTNLQDLVCPCTGSQAESVHYEVGSEAPRISHTGSAADRAAFQQQHTQHQLQQPPPMYRPWAGEPTSGSSSNSLRSKDTIAAIHSPYYSPSAAAPSMQTNSSSAASADVSAADAAVEDLAQPPRSNRSSMTGMVAAADGAMYQVTQVHSPTDCCVLQA